MALRDGDVIHMEGTVSGRRAMLYGLRSRQALVTQWVVLLKTISATTLAGLWTRAVSLGTDRIGGSVLVGTLGSGQVARRCFVHQSLSMVDR